jgi:hypothetical protein
VFVENTLNGAAQGYRAAPKEKRLIRYEQASDEAVDLLNGVQNLHFPELKNAKIALLYDLKKRTVSGKVMLGQIKKPNDLIRHFTKDEAVAIEGYDYIIILDKVCFENVPETDRIRILRHELRHTFYDIESEDNPYKLVDHDITDFHAEVELNKDDPRWAHRCATLTADIYEQYKEDAKDRKTRAKKRKREYQIHPRQMTIGVNEPPSNGLKEVLAAQVEKQEESVSRCLSCPESIQDQGEHKECRLDHCRDMAPGSEYRTGLGI